MILLRDVNKIHVDVDESILPRVAARRRDRRDSLPFYFSHFLHHVLSDSVLTLMIRGINSKDEQGNDNIIAARRPRRRRGN